jgi:tetratricopeptide (TPR) repeat protein
MTMECRRESADFRTTPKDRRMSKQHEPTLAHLDDPALRQRAMQRAADAAIAKGAAGKNALPADLHAGFDLVLQAFKHYEAGRDELARTTIQGIGLQSPFLEWKVLLRGLLAYYASDDARALENWRRLDPDRLPHRLCAALRAGIDPEFLKALPAPIQKSLHARIAAQTGSAFAESLRHLGVSLTHENLAPAFRKAEALVKNMGREFPQLMPRLAHCFFWAILDHGQPEDLERYLRVFGRPADDPELHRLEALCLEMRGLWPEAHKVWQSFIEHVAKSPKEWPGEIGIRVQAMIWSHMAGNALPHLRRRSKSANPFFDLFADQTAPFKPNAERCYEKAIALAPDRLAGYVPLFDLYRRAGKLAKAKKLGQQMVKRFPDHADTLEALGELCLEARDFKKAQEYFERSIQANPLDLELRGKLARARQKFGLKLTLEKKYDAARTQYEKTLQLWDGPKTPLLCQWAVAEMAAGNSPHAEALIAQALAEPDQRLACRNALVGASVRAKLPPKQKKLIADDLKAALAQAPTPAETLVLLESAAAQRQVHDETFHGQKTQEKSILKFLDAIQFDDFSEEQLQRLATGLETLNARKPWLDCLNHARSRYLKNPFFRLSFVDYYLMVGREANTNMAGEHLNAARCLVEQMPRGEQQQRYLDAIKEKEAIIAELSARDPSLTDVFDRIFGDFDPDMDEDDDEDYDDGPF